MVRFEQQSFGRVKHIHCIGIGGSGMSGIAEVLLSLGYKVSGSDLVRSKVTEKLSLLGIVINENHSEENVVGADVVVFSSAIDEGNPELLAARKKESQ